MPHAARGRRLLRLAAALLATTLPGAAAHTAHGALKPPDYTATANLSKPVHGPDDIVRETMRLPVSDGTEIYVEVTRPRGATGVPVILEASPYHGTLADREGTRILPEPRDAEGDPIGLTGYFVPRGYAVVMMDLRGTGRSGGCLDHLGPKDAGDLKAIVEWAASQPWSNGRVGMTGHSYVGSTPSLAAAQRPNGLVTIVPSAGLAQMYDHQFQAGVPYFLQWAGPMEAYEQLALERFLPGGDHDITGSGKDDAQDFGCGLPNSSLTAGEAQLSGAYVEWHRQRDWRAAATRAPIPVFMVHGVNDNAARVTGMQWFTDRQAAFAGSAQRPADKLWLGQWDHGSGCCPTRRGLQWTAALHAWFDRHVARRAVDTGPPVELFLADAATLPAAIPSRTEVHVARTWPGSPEMRKLHPRSDGSLAGSADALPGSVAFAGDPRGFARPSSTGAAEFVGTPAAQDTLLAGVPELKLVASVTAPRVHLIANIYDQSPTGERRRISQFAINPELRNGIDRPEPVVPGQAMTLDPPAFAMAHNLRQGHRLVLRVTTSDPDKVPTFAVDPQVRVYTGAGGTELEVPVVTTPDLHPDTVPLAEGDPRKPRVGEAQPTQRTSVTPPGAGPERVDGVTAVVHEFDVQEGFDNAQFLASAEPAIEADIDLYLERRAADGSWEEVTSGASARLTDELLATQRPEPGRYRLAVHNWAGVPATRVDVTLTFVNSAGEPGPSVTG